MKLPRMGPGQQLQGSASCETQAGRTPVLTIPRLDVLFSVV